ALYNLHSLIQECKTMLPRPHSNTSHSPKNILSTETVNKTKSFINLMGERHGEALAVQKYTQKKTDRQIIVTYEKHDNVLLPSHYSYDRLLAIYNLMNSNNLIKSHNTFKKIWKSDPTLNVELPHDSQQPGKWYYLLLLKAYQFGLVDEEVKYHFQIKGHTRNSVDHGFGLTKREYAILEIWCMNQLAEVIEKSASNNMP
ncbi:4759_t:CDS:2, partial [Racocetra fulgida]